MVEPGGAMDRLLNETGVLMQPNESLKSAVARGYTTTGLVMGELEHPRSELEISVTMKTPVSP
jgi:hypothetical protein